MIETTVADVDTSSPPVIEPETSVAEAAACLRRSDVPALVVLDDERPVGVVTASDVVALVAETDERPPVHAIMSTPVMTTSPAATLPEAAETMRTAGVKHLPVTSGGVYRGLLSARTLAPYLPRNSLDIEWTAEPLSLDPAGTTGVTAGD